jgi:glycine/D-amino acid oxidase-like deaminating enzyme
MTSRSPDVAIVGGGIVGVAAAAFLARAGAAVQLFERAALAAAASGRNSGAVQHPYDPELVPLHQETLALYRDLPGFDLADEPAGVLVLARDADALGPVAAGLRRTFPELEPAVVDAHAADPAVAPGLAACRLRSGHPVRPADATLAYARAAREAGADLRTGAEAAVADGGVVVDRELRAAGAVLVAAGPWTPAVVEPTGAWRPIAPVWGVNVEVALADPPRAIVEEGGVEAAVSGGAPAQLFSLVTAGGVGALGSTFLDAEPDPAAHAPGLLAHGSAFVPALAGAEPVSVRACARPQSFDGRPLLGPVPGRDGLFVAAGHGPWGISSGPASARLVADAILGRVGAIPPALDVARACAG